MMRTHDIDKFPACDPGAGEREREKCSAHVLLNLGLLSTLFPNLNAYFLKHYYVMETGRSPMRHLF